MMICSRDDNSLFSLLCVHIIVARLIFLTSPVIVCVCHAELKGYFLTYLKPTYNST